MLKKLRKITVSVDTGFDKLITARELQVSFKTRRVFRSFEYRRYVDTIAMLLKNEIKRNLDNVTFPVFSRVDISVDILFVLPRRYANSRRGDLDNLLKPALDAAEGILFDNDKYIVALSARKTYDGDTVKIFYYIEVSP